VRLRLFLCVSIAIHLLIAAGIYSIPPEKEKKKQEFSARLVTPQEALQPQVIPMPKPPAQKPAPVPLIKPPRATAQKREPRSPRVPVVPYTSPTPVSPDLPVVPGEGSGTGKALPKGPLPGTGTPEGPGAGKGLERSPESSRPGSARSRIFDRSITEQIAGKDPAAQSGNSSEITFDTREYRYAGYMNKLRDKIQSVWVYPAEAASRGIYGDLKIRFTINKDGRLGKIELVRTSGYKTLDDSAVRALKEGEPYWPLPEEWKMDSYTILGHFIYSLYGYQQLR